MTVVQLGACAARNVPAMCLEKLKKKERKGSKPRCHWLTHGPREQVANRLAGLVGPCGTVRPDDNWMPEGFADTKEARLDKECALLADKYHRRELRDWWLAVPKGANTPKWDIASTCCVNGRKGFLLVEAKAHTRELEDRGKPLAVVHRRTRVAIMCKSAHV